MMCDKTETVPQVSENLTVDSDRVKASLVDVGPLDSGEDQLHIRTSLSIEDDPFRRRDYIQRTPPKSNPVQLDQKEDKVFVVEVKEVGTSQTGSINDRESSILKKRLREDSEEEEIEGYKKT